MGKNQNKSGEAADAAAETPESLVAAGLAEQGTVTFKELLELRESLRKEITEAMAAGADALKLVQEAVLEIQTAPKAASRDLPLVKYMIGEDEERLAIIAKVEDAHTGRCTLLVIKNDTNDLAGHP